MPLRLPRCFSTLGCPDATLPEALALAVRFSVDAVEIRGLGGELHAPAYFARTYGSADRLAAEIHGSGVGIRALDTSFRLVGATAEDRDALLEYVPWAEQLGVRWLRVFDGGHDSAETTLAAAAETLGWWHRLRRQEQWQTDLMIETHDSLLDGSALNQFYQHAPQAHILWDAHNTWRKSGENPLATWPMIKSRVVHVHVKDSVTRPSDRHPYTYVLPGDGEFPMRELSLALAGDSYGGALSLEWERRWLPDLPPLEEALQRAAALNWW